MNPHGSAIDRLTQRWVRATGRMVDLQQEAWLDGPIGDPTRIAHDWIPQEAARLGAREYEGGGLLASFDELASETFDPVRLSPSIIDFYEHTANWRLDVSSRWSPIAMPGGWLIAVLFATRLQQLALPLRPVGAAQGMDSRVVALRHDNGKQVGAAWLRTLRSTGQVVYSGLYSSTQLPNCAHPSIRVAFPLPNGSITVFLRPSVESDGSLTLTSPLGAQGDDGAYLIVRDRKRAWVRRVPLAERFHVYVDDDGTLRTDHALKLWNIPVLRLHYRMLRKRNR
jgi:hypothetical protein